MPDESPESRTLEVLALPAGVDEELLFLYFENRRRSGGGPLVSVEKKGDRAILLFEEAEVAAQVLSKGHHVLHNVELTVRRPASHDHCRLLLRGTNPSTSTEMIELYVENMMGLNTDYTLHPSPQRDLVLIHLSQPLTKDLQSISARIAKRKLDGAAVTLEQMEETDSILVENLHPGTTPNLLTLHFENKGAGSVKEVTMLSQGTAKVSFVTYQSVGIVLSQSHKLEDTDLTVTPYYDFLQPTRRRTSCDAAAASQATSAGNSEDQSEHVMHTDPSIVVNENHQSSQSSPQKAPEPYVAQEAMEESIEEAMEDRMEAENVLYTHIPIADPVKLALFLLSTLKQDIEKAHPNCTIQIKDNDIHITATDRQSSEQVKHDVSRFFGKMTESRLPLEPDKAKFLARNDVKERLLHSMSQTGSPSMYTVSDCTVVVTSVSKDWADQACGFLKAQLCQFSLPVDAEMECLFCCREWAEFLQNLSFSHVTVPERGGVVDVLTLKGMEGEKQRAVLEFLSTPIQRETVISMEPGQLKFIQNHHHQLLADMDQVSIFPLEAGDACGLKIVGPAIACQMAEEVLQGVLSSIVTRTITVNAPGVTRYLMDQECQSILKEMETKFSVYICTKHVPWEYMAFQDILQTAWTMMSDRNFERVTLDGSAQDLRSDSMQTDNNGAVDTGLLEVAKRIVSSVDQSVDVADELDNMDNVDLYTDDDPTSLADPGSDGAVGDASQAAAAGSDFHKLSDGAVGFSSELEEEAQMSLAIQYSMETSHWSLQDEEEQLRKALELSKSMIQHETAPSNSGVSPAAAESRKAAKLSLQEAIKAASTIQLVVFAGYSCDLIRVDIAFGKKVSQRQVEEKLEHRCLRNLNDYHRKCLDLIKRKHGVEVQVQGTIVTISGFKDFVCGGVADVKLFLEKVSNAVSDREILRSVQWCHIDPVSSEMIPYSPDANVFIENIWKLKLQDVVMCLDNQLHTIKFDKMQEYNKASGKSVKICRRLVDAEDFNEEVPEEEYTMLSNLPDVSRVDEESDEFQNVVKNFYETIQEYHSKIRIIKVEKIMNRLLYNQYKLKKASILRSATYPEAERTLYHGTTDTTVREICVHGFNRSFCGKNATVYGQGVYFAVNSALSVQEQYSPSNADGHKFVIVSKVLTGDYTKGTHSMKTAPLKETGEIPLRYDSVTDDITKPTMFVIFNDTQAFPEYVITCQRIHR